MSKPYREYTPEDIYRLREKEVKLNHSLELIENIKSVVVTAEDLTKESWTQSLLLHILELIEDYNKLYLDHKEEK